MKAVVCLLVATTMLRFLDDNAMPLVYVSAASIVSPTLLRGSRNLSWAKKSPRGGKNCQGPNCKKNDGGPVEITVIHQFDNFTAPDAKGPNGEPCQFPLNCRENPKKKGTGARPKNGGQKDKVKDDKPTRKGQAKPIDASTTKRPMSKVTPTESIRPLDTSAEATTTSTLPSTRATTTTTTTHRATTTTTRPAATTTTVEADVATKPTTSTTESTTTSFHEATIGMDLGPEPFHAKSHNTFDPDNLSSSDYPTTIGAIVVTTLPSVADRPPTKVAKDDKKVPIDATSDPHKQQGKAGEKKPKQHPKVPPPRPNQVHSKLEVPPWLSNSPETTGVPTPGDTTSTVPDERDTNADPVPQIRPLCEDAYSLFLECTVIHIENCLDCNRASPGLNPREDCPHFEEWYNENDNCCTSNECGTSLDNFKTCYACHQEGEASAEDIPPASKQPESKPTRKPVPKPVKPKDPPLAKPTKPYSSKKVDQHPQQGPIDSLLPQAFLPCCCTCTMLPCDCQCDSLQDSWVYKAVSDYYSNQSEKDKSKQVNLDFDSKTEQTERSRQAEEAEIVCCCQVAQCDSYPCECSCSYSAL